MDLSDLWEESEVVGSNTTTDLLRHPSGIVPKVSHVVCQFFLGIPVDLPFLCLKLLNTRYTFEAIATTERKPSRFRRMMLELVKPRVNLAVFHTGKVRIFSAKDEAMARLAARNLVRKLHRLEEYKEARVSEFRVENYVAGTGQEFLGPLNLSHLYHLLIRRLEATVTPRQDKGKKKDTEQAESPKNNSGRIEFEPELFNGLRYKKVMNGNNVCVEAFASGSVRITGCKSIATLNQIFASVYPDLVSAQRPRMDLDAPVPPKKVRRVWKDMTTS